LTSPGDHGGPLAIDERYTIQRMLVLRKVTRAVTELLRGQLKDYLTTLGPVFRPSIVLGEYVEGTKNIVRGADKIFKEFVSIYETVATVKPYNLPKEIKHPLEIGSSTVEFLPVEYKHIARLGPESKPVLITSPLKWVLSYAGYGVVPARELVSDSNRPRAEVKEFVVHPLLMHVITKQPGVTQLFEALQFPIEAERFPDLGDLPVTVVTSAISTLRPPDEVIIESTEIAGRDSFEEVINLDDIGEMRSPLQDKLVEIVRSYDPKLLP
jgi:hypothetical protein